MNAADFKIVTPPTPTAFETRNIGATLELEATISDDALTIDLRLAPEITYHVGELVWSEFQDSRGSSDIKTPLFYTIRLNTSVTVAVGKYQLAAMVSPKNDKGFTDNSHKVFVFVKSDTLSVDH